ncbi:hypothetical protein DT075_10735 [Bacillus licheniformis]|nr:hypothetical protein DT075_10735 [Bacillus licheniformis]
MQSWFEEHGVKIINCANITKVEEGIVYNHDDPIQADESYDDAVIGLGCEDKYHNVPGAPEHTYSIQTIDQSRSTYQALNNLNAEATVAIVGAGLSGVELASEHVMITLIDRNPYHCLKTEYYALAAGTISDHHIRVSFPDHPKLKIEYGTISSVDLEGKKVLFHDREPVIL